MMNRRLCNERREYMKLHRAITVYKTDDAEATDVVTTEGYWTVETAVPERLRRQPRKSELDD